MRNSTSVGGTVTNVDVEENTRGDTTKYDSVLEYEYEHLGESYTGESLYPGDLDRRLSSAEKARELLDEFVEGEQLSLYVNPDNLVEPFVFRETTPLRNYGAILVGLLLLVVGIWGLFQQG